MAGRRATRAKGTVKSSDVELKPKEVNTSDDVEQEPHFSYSQMNMYQRCPKQYEYRYIKGMKVPPNINMNSGKAIHEAFEYNALWKMRSKEDMPMQDLLDLSSTSHDKFMGQVEDLDKKAAGVNKDENQGIVALYRRTQAPSITPIAAEHAFRIELPDDDGGNYLPVIGVIDSISEVPDDRPGPPGGRVIALEDYKRVSRKKQQSEADLSPQLTLYDYATTLTIGHPVDVIGFRQLGFLKKDGPYSIPIYRQPQTMEARENRWRRVLNQMKGVQKAIKDENFVPVDNPQICGWCGYKEICQNKAEE